MILNVAPSFNRNTTEVSFTRPINDRKGTPYFIVETVSVRE